MSAMDIIILLVTNATLTSLVVFVVQKYFEAKLRMDLEPITQGLIAREQNRSATKLKAYMDVCETLCRHWESIEWRKEDGSLRPSRAGKPVPKCDINRAAAALAVFCTDTALLRAFGKVVQSGMNVWDIDDFYKLLWKDLGYADLDLPKGEFAYFFTY